MFAPLQIIHLDKQCDVDGQRRPRICKKPKATEPQPMADRRALAAVYAWRGREFDAQRRQNNGVDALMYYSSASSF
jgi:hypothetical protein